MGVSNPGQRLLEFQCHMQTLSPYRTERRVLLGGLGTQNQSMDHFRQSFRISSMLHFPTSVEIQILPFSYFWECCEDKYINQNNYDRKGLLEVIQFNPLFQSSRSSRPDCPGSCPMETARCSYFKERGRNKKNPIAGSDEFFLFSFSYIQRLD